MIKLTFANREITPYFARTEMKGMNPVEKIVEAITESVGLFALITPNVTNDTHTRDWVVFEVGVAKARGITILSWVDQKVATAKSYPRLLENITDYDEFDCENDQECYRVVDSIRDSAFKLAGTQKKDKPTVKQLGDDLVRMEAPQRKTEETMAGKKEITSERLRKEITRKVVLLPDADKIADLSVNNDLLNQIYEQAHHDAFAIYPDAQLSDFCIQVFPFVETSSKVNIYLSFYSKWADRNCDFMFSESSPFARHSPPDKLAKSGDYRKVFPTLPWRESPNWIQFLKRVIAKIGPLSPQSMTRYHLRATPREAEWQWTLNLEDEFTGKPYSYSWNGKKLGDNDIVQII